MNYIRESSFRLSCFYMLIIILYSVSGLHARPADTNGRLSPAGFKNPPVSARPTAWWDWLESSVSLPQLTRDLEEMKDKGLGGAEIWDVAALRNTNKQIPAGPAFLSPQSVKAIRHALREGRRLGLRMGMMAVSGWNAGGSWIKPEDAGKALYISKINIEGPRQISKKLPFPELPEDSDGNYAIKIPKSPEGLPEYYQDIAVLAIPVTDDSLIRSMDSIIDLTGVYNMDGILNWSVPDGKWIILRFVCSNTGQQLICAGPNSKGPFIDFLDPAVTRNYLSYIIDKISENNENLKESSLDYLFLDSMELSHGTPWTGNFRNEFTRLRGYDPLMYLPVLDGWKVIDEDVTGRFIYDLKKTISDLLIFSHYETGSNILHDYGLKFAAEAGGPGPPIWESCPVDALKALGAVDIPRGEFWIRHRNLFLIKQIASASHIYGKKLVDAESFTTWRRWKDAPFDYKRIADRAFCEGLNCLSLVTFAHSPPDAGIPGWTFHAGSDFNPNVTWWPKARPFMDYLSRCCYMLRQGFFAADVCFYYGDKAPNFFPEYHDVPEKPVLKSLGTGYDFDVTNSEVILTRMDVKDGKIVLPDGMNYELLLLPDIDEMSLEVLKKLEYLVRSGATVIGPKPAHSVSLAGYPESDNEINRLADIIWGSCDGLHVKENSYGKGRVIWGKTAREVLREREIGPDFMYLDPAGRAELDYIHRRTENRDIYFVRNKSDRSEELDCIFRVNNMRPEIWDPATGEIQSRLPYKTTDGGTGITLRFSPGGSIFVIFVQDEGGDHVTDIKRTGLIKRNLNLPPLDIISADEKPGTVLAGQNGFYTLEMSDGTERRIDVHDIPEKIEVNGGWDVAFPEGWGAPPQKTFQKLISWTASETDGVKYFSGTAVYKKRIEIPADYINTDIELFIDLGRVEEIADVRLNRKSLGILWKPPFRINITAAAQPGMNELEIEITNLWVNRLAGDLKLPENQRFCRTNQPAPARNNEEDIIWEPLESGLLGPVNILAARKIPLAFSKEE